MVSNHETNSWTINELTHERIKAIPKESEYINGDPPGREFKGRNLACKHPQVPIMSGDYRDLPVDKCPDALLLADARNEGEKNHGRFGRLTKNSHLSTILTKSCTQINSKTCGPVIHYEADRVLTVREIARGQGIPDRINIHGSLIEKYKQCGNGVPCPLAEALGRELRRAHCLALKLQ